jgi:alkylhydroperoxidase family enzyme
LKSHAAVAAVLLERESTTPVNGEEFVAGVIRDLETSGLSEKEKALLRFVDRVNHHSLEIGSEDMQTLYAVSWDDAAIYYAITVCALFNFYNRWVDASGVHALSDEMHRVGAKRSANMGYVRK